MIKRWVVNLLAEIISQEVEDQLRMVQEAEIDAEIDAAVSTLKVLDKMADQLFSSIKCIAKLDESGEKLANRQKTMAIGMLDLNDRLKAIEKEMEEKVLH